MIVRLVRRRLLPSNRRHNRMDGCSNHSSNNGVNHSNSRRGSPGNLNSSGANHSNLPSSPHSSPGVNRSSHSGCSRHSNSRHGLRRGITAAGVDSSANSKITGLARKIKEGEPEKAWILPSICDSPLLPHEPCNDRGKVLHLSCIDLKVGESVALALLKEMCYRLRHTKWSLWNGWPSCLGGEISSTVGDHQVVDRLTQFQVGETLPRGFFDPRNLLLHGGICWISTLRADS